MKISSFPIAIGAVMHGTHAVNDIKSISVNTFGVDCSATTNIYGPDCTNYEFIIPDSHTSLIAFVKFHDGTFTTVQTLFE